VDIRYKDEALARLAVEEGDGGYPPGIGKAFRKRVQTIEAAPDERVLRSWKSLHFEELADGRHSIRLNKQWRMILEFEGRGSNKVVIVVGIEDYH
jgi:proteic killer suppression protein